MQHATKLDCNTLITSSIRQVVSSTELDKRNGNMERPYGHSQATFNK